MTLSEIQDQINDFIVANGNNEITADVLRPILLGIVGQPNELIGDLANLTTTEQSNLVAAINEINSALSTAGGITIHTGADTPLVTPPGTFTTGDFYLQEVASVVVSFWQFNGQDWVAIKNIINDAVTATDTTWSSEKIQQAINERDGFITLGAIAYTDNSATVPAGAQWRIAGVVYTNPADVILTINPATAGYYRTDIIVANTSNTFQIVEGTESSGTVAPAATPVSTVKADEINIYGAAVVSTGPGGGFINVVGFFDYNDEATQTTPIAFTTGVPVKLTNDALGPYTNLTEGPYGVTTIWDTADNSFNFSQLSVGDTIDLRLDLDVSTSGSNHTVKIYLKLGAGSPAQFDLPIWDNTYKTAAQHNIGAYFGFYIGSEDILNYPADLYLVSTDGSGTVKVNGWYPRIIRKGVNVYTLAVDDQDYVKKQFAGAYNYDTVDGDNAVLELQPQGYSNLVLTNMDLNSVDGFNLDLITGVPGAYIPYEGKVLKVYNSTGTELTLTHDGTADIPFIFRGEEDIVVPAGEFIYLDFHIGGCVDGLRSWGSGVSLQDVTTEGNTSLNSITIYSPGTSFMELLPYGVYVENQLNGDNMSLTAYSMQFGDTAYASNFLFRSRTQNTDFYLEDEGGEKSIATREWVSANLPGLQQVTDIGNTTSNEITVSDLSGAFASLSNLGVYGEEPTDNKYFAIDSEGVVFGIAAGSTYQVRIFRRDLTQNTDFFLEDEGGDKSIATREWVNSNKWLLKSTNATAAVSGTTSLTQIGSSIFIPANTFSAEDAMLLESFAVEKTTGGGTCVMSLHHNTVDSLGSSTLIARNSLASGNVSSRIIRLFEITAGRLKCRVDGGSSVTSDVVNYSFSPLNIAFDPAIDNYFFTAVQLSNAVDSVVRTQLLISK